MVSISLCFDSATGNSKILCMSEAEMMDFPRTFSAVGWKVVD